MTFRPVAGNADVKLILSIVTALVSPGNGAENGKGIARTAKRNYAPQTTMKFPTIAGFCLLALLAACTGCVPKAPSEVVVYVALDRQFSEPVLKQFEAETGIRVLPKYDIESNKTVGLASAIEAERNRPRADLFWNNEALHSARLAQAGLAEAYASPQAEFLPASCRDPDNHWHGFAARGRVLVVNTKLLPDETAWPRSVRELADPKWKANCGVARPLLGTTATHAMLLGQQWGEGTALDFFAAVRGNAVLEGGNLRVALHVAEGQYAWGLTDTDDAIIQIEKGFPVRIIWPNQGPDDAGAVLIPNTLMIVKGGPNPDNARRLVDWLLRPETEALLAAAASAQIPMHAKSTARSRVWPEMPPRMSAADFGAAARLWEKMLPRLVELFQQ